MYCFPSSDGCYDDDICSNAQNIMTTFAGTGIWGSSGDGGAATSAQLNYPEGVSVDISGIVYIADNGNNKIRMVNSTGIITTIAGTGVPGSTGDGGAATFAQLDHPYGVSVDISGKIYISEYNNHKIRMVNSRGIITTFAGTGIYGGSGDGGMAINAQLSGPYGVAVDISGKIYIADAYNHKIRMVFPRSQPTIQPTQVIHKHHHFTCLRTAQNTLTSCCSHLFYHPTSLPPLQSSMQPSTHPTPALVGCAAGMYSMSMAALPTPMCAVCPAGTFSAYAAFHCTVCADGTCRFTL